MGIATRKLLRVTASKTLSNTTSTYPNLLTHPGAVWTRNGYWLSSPGRLDVPVFDIDDGFVLGETEPTWENSGCRYTRAELTQNDTPNLVTSYDGQIIEKVYLPIGRIEVRHKNVIIRDCIIQIGPPEGGGRLLIQNNAAIVHNPNYDTSGNIIMYVTCDPVNAGVGGAADDANVGGFYAYGASFFRCAIRKVSDGFMPDVRTGLVKPSYIWGNYVETRWLSYDPKQPDGTHNDGIQLAGGNGDALIGNSLHNPTGGVTDPGSGMVVKGQCIIFTPYHIPRLEGTWVMKNWLYGSFTQISIWNQWDGERSGSQRLINSGPLLSGIRIIGNRHMGQCAWPFLLTPAQNAGMTLVTGEIVGAGGLKWNNRTDPAGAVVSPHVAAHTGGTGL